MVTRPSDLVRLGLAVEFDEEEGDGPPAPSWLAPARSRYASIELLVRLGVAIEVEGGCTGGDGCGCSEVGPSSTARTPPKGAGKVGAAPGSGSAGYKEAHRTNQNVDETVGRWPSKVLPDDYSLWPDIRFDCSTPRCDSTLHAGHYDVAADCESTARDIIGLAWCILVENIDLVWEAFGWRGFGIVYLDCITRLLVNYLNLIRFSCPEELAIGDYFAYSHGFAIEFDNQKFARKVITKWERAEARALPGERHKGKMCVAADLAATILHELAHKCGIAMWDANTIADSEFEYAGEFRDAGPCQGRESYRLENTFRYLISLRLCVLGYWCCSWNSGHNRDALVTSPIRNSCSYDTSNGECDWP